MQSLKFTSQGIVCYCHLSTRVLSCCCLCACLCCVPAIPQARTEAVVSSLQSCCSGLAEQNSTVVGEAVMKCPPENVTALSTALAQATNTTDGAATVAEVCVIREVVCSS